MGYGGLNFELLEIVEDAVRFLSIETVVRCLVRKSVHLVNLVRRSGTRKRYLYFGRGQYCSPGEKSLSAFIHL